MDHSPRGCPCIEAERARDHMKSIAAMQEANDSDVKKAFAIVQDMEKVIKRLHAENCELRGIPHFDIQVLV